MTRQGRTTLVVGLVGLAFASLIAVRVLAATGWDVSVFAAFGEEETASRAYGERQLGEVYLRTQFGHDGKFFFIQANDPLYLEPSEHAIALDRPLYRAQRMLYPLLAGGLGLFPPEAILWSMLVINLAAVGVGSWVVAVLATEMGGSPWWGLAFGLNLGFISEMSIGGAGIVAAAAAFGAVAAYTRKREGWGVLLLVLAALSREAMLIAAAGTAWWLWGQRRRGDAVVSALVPVAAVGMWALYLRMRLGWDQGAAQIQEIGLPFRGFYRALQGWIGDPVNLVAGVTMMLILVFFVRRVLMSTQLLGWAFLGFVALGVVFTDQVWRSYFDITRAVAPLTTAFVLMVVLDGNGSSPQRMRYLRSRVEEVRGTE